MSFIKVGVEYLDKNGTILDTDYTFVVSGENLQPTAAKSFSIMTKRDPKMTNFRYHIIKN
ncbi:MAG: hypothetical protein KFB94_03215 [Methylophilaceae bacterium]|nr:MAG: hypothetical protein KFB94_03215 [Methylophilaceae bacterium]